MNEFRNVRQPQVFGKGFDAKLATRRVLSIKFNNKVAAPKLGNLRRVESSARNEEHLEIGGR